MKILELQQSEEQAISPPPSFPRTSSLLLPPYFPAVTPALAVEAAAAGPCALLVPISTLRLFACLKRARASGFFWRPDMKTRGMNTVLSKEMTGPGKNKHS